MSYDEALGEALCYGWIDGRLRGGDDRMFRRTFTPRRPGSVWSKRNVTIATMLIEQGRMRPSGLAAVSRAKADGTWDAAYDGQATIEVPADLAAALARDPAAKAMFDTLDAANRYAILYRVTTAKRPDTRRRRVEQFTAMLARGETPH
ncbi:MAG TPA: YdeI/OmpD-associated family protein, partial [Acidimicrobiales bacterium]|nr:YdeI/OmpD-associated family protein [Acidimicrobiales bacterium]